MLIAKKAWLLMVAVSVIFGGFQLLGQPPGTVTCRQATLTRPNLGVAYRGTVTNEDYKLSATVPEGDTGWGGVAADAPFQGFTIFLDPFLQSCILFEVHIRIDDADRPTHPRAARALSLGKAKAWQTSARVTANGREIMNLRTIFTFDHDGETDDGQITLVAPASEQRSKAVVYNAFLKSVRFGSH